MLQNQGNGYFQAEITRARTEEPQDASQVETSDGGEKEDLEAGTNTGFWFGWDMWAQQRRLIGLKQGIQHYGAVKARWTMALQHTSKVNSPWLAGRQEDLLEGVKDIKECLWREVPGR